MVQKHYSDSPKTFSFWYKNIIPTAQKHFPDSTKRFSFQLEALLLSASILTIRSATSWASSMSWVTKMPAKPNSSCIRRMSWASRRCKGLTISRGSPVLRHTPPGCHQALQGTGGVGGAGGGKADGWTPGAWQKMPLVQLVGLLTVGVDAADGGGGENGADVIGNHLGNAAVRGAADGAGGHHIPQGHPMGQKEAPPLLHPCRSQPLPRRRIPCHQVRAFSAEDAGQHLPEAVAGVAVKEELLPGADGGKAPQNQDAGVGVKHRRDGMKNGGQLTARHGVLLILSRRASSQQPPAKRAAWFSHCKAACFPIPQDEVFPAVSRTNRNVFLLQWQKG